MVRIITLRMVETLNTQVPVLLRAVAEQHLLPRLGTCSSSMKAPGEVVTEADVAAEAALSEGLRTLLPGSAVIGEEAASENPAILQSISEHAAVWIVDPLDGTRHFAEGTGPFGIMVALLLDGRCEASWIFMPMTGELACAWRGRGVTLDGAVIRIPPIQSPLRGGLLTRFFPSNLKARTEAITGLERTDGRHHCAARRYLDLLLGREHVAAYWRTLPWDHVPGALMVEEAGGVVLRLDGSPYRPDEVDRTGLLVAADEAVFARLRAAILGED